MRAIGQGQLLFDEEITDNNHIFLEILIFLSLRRFRSPDLIPYFDNYSIYFCD